MLTVADQWKVYETLVLDPIKAGPVQRVETKRAFYAGAAAMLGLFGSVDDSVDVEAGVEYLNQLTAEVRDFAAALKVKPSPAGMSQDGGR